MIPVDPLTNRSKGRTAHTLHSPRTNTLCDCLDRRRSPRLSRHKLYPVSIINDHSGPPMRVGAVQKGL